MTTEYCLRWIFPVGSGECVDSPSLPLSEVCAGHRFVVLQFRKIVVQFSGYIATGS